MLLIVVPGGRLAYGPTVQRAAMMANTESDHERYSVLKILKALSWN